MCTIGPALTGLALVAVTRAGQVWHCYLLWGGLLGLASALAFRPDSVVVAANWLQRKHGVAMALLTALVGFALPIVVPLAGWLILVVGWRGALLALAGVNLAIAPPLHALLLRRHPADVGLLPDGEPVLPASKVASIPL